MDHVPFMKFVILISISSVVLFRKQFLLILLSLEIAALGIFMLMFSLYLIYTQTLSLCFYMLVIVACEASLGLTLLVVLGRTKGSDNLVMLSV